MPFIDKTLLADFHAASIACATIGIMEIRFPPDYFVPFTFRLTALAPRIRNTAIQ